MSPADFNTFRTSFSKAITNSGKYKILYPENNGSSIFFWVTSFGAGIGGELCHYEFVAENEKTSNSIINLEIHFEVATSQDELFLKKILCLKKILGRIVEARYNTEKIQVGIKYAQFDYNSPNLIADAKDTFEKMDKIFKRKLPFIIFKLCLISLFKIKV